MLKIILDTNVLVSAFIMGGKPLKLLHKSTRDQQCVLLSSSRLINEAARVLSRPKFERYSAVSVNVLHPDLFDLVTVKSKFRAVPNDPDDDMVINAAYDGHADYIVSGDKHLLNMKEFRGIPVVTVARMLDILEGLPI